MLQMRGAHVRERRTGIGWLQSPPRLQLSFAGDADG
jgi:hypothetical protein